MVSTKAVVELKSARRQHKKRTIEDGRRWEEKYKAGESVLKIAKEDGTDPKLVSSWLHRLGVEFKQGHHRVAQPPLKLPPDLVELGLRGPEQVLGLLSRSAWGIRASENGKAQLTKFCQFLKMYGEGKGVAEIAGVLRSHRSSIAEWRKGTDQPYLVRVASEVLARPPQEGTMLLPLRLTSGAEVQSMWIFVPTKVESYLQIEVVLEQLTPAQNTLEIAKGFGITESVFKTIRAELFAYFLAVMAGDASKSGGEQERFASMSIDLQLTKKEGSNERLGNFVCMCAGALGIEMRRITDKKPSGATRFGRSPSAAFRWTSERSPLLAWMFSVCLGLKWAERTSYDPIRMDWILGAPKIFRVRFVQGLADSDGSVKHHQVIITSVPNAEFLARILRGLGVTSAHQITEKGKPLRTYVSSKQAAALPLFNEVVGGYRYRKLRQLGY